MQVEPYVSLSNHAKIPRKEQLNDRTNPFHLLPSFISGKKAAGVRAPLAINCRTPIYWSPSNQHGENKFHIRKMFIICCIYSLLSELNFRVIKHLKALVPTLHIVLTGYVFSEGHKF